MSLYGLDILITNNGKRFLNEINGIVSGMAGFEQIYLDNRVEEKVYKMLRREYGRITVNNGAYTEMQAREKHPVRYLLKEILSRTPVIKKIFSDKNPLLISGKAETDWLIDGTPKIEFCYFPFPVYKGQRSTIINMRNEELPHPSINPIVTEAIAENKFLQYLLLNNSEIAGIVPESSLVGLGATDEEGLEKLISNSDNFVVKPILGCCGKGVRFLTKDAVIEKYQNSRGPVDYMSLSEAFKVIRGKHLKRVYFEDLIEQEDFSFENGVAIIQPFIDSRQADDPLTYSVIRAIVCNGKFIDAYKRVSSNPRVNLSQDAIGVSFNYDEDFAEFCENIIEVFERKTQEYSFDSYQKILYQQYIDTRGITTGDQRKSDLNTELERIYPLIDSINKLHNSLGSL